jgi:hypothetical protein
VFDRESNQPVDPLLHAVSAFLLIAITLLTALGANVRSPNHPPGIEGVTVREK